MMEVLPALYAAAIVEIAGATLRSAAQGIVGNRADAAFTRTLQAIQKTVCASATMDGGEGDAFSAIVVKAFARSIKAHIGTLSSQSRNLSDRQIVDRLARADAELATLPILSSRAFSASLLGSGTAGAGSAEERLALERSALAARVADWCSEVAGCALPAHFAETFDARGPDGAPPWIELFRKELSHELDGSTEAARILTLSRLDEIFGHTIDVRTITRSLSTKLGGIETAIAAVEDDIRAVRATQSDQLAQLRQLDSLLRMFAPSSSHENTLRALRHAMFGEVGTLRPVALITFEAWRNDGLVVVLTRDQRLRIVGEFLERLSLTLPGNCICLHYQGGEFDIIVSGGPSRSELHEVRDIVMATCARSLSEGSFSVRFSPAFGIAMAPEHGFSPETLCRNAQVALGSAIYSDSKIAFFDTSLTEEAQERALIEIDLREAIAGNQLELLYQPQVDLTDGTIIAGEALVRWNHPERGVVMPSVFIPLAEDSELIADIETWVLSRACRDAALWPQQKRVAVNISPVQVISGKLSERVKSALLDTGLAGERLEIELTESAFLSDGIQLMDRLSELRDLGVHMALDDFGTGYSSLSYLTRYPFNKIKIDRSFVSRSGSFHGAGIVRAIADLASGLGMATVAEGVETEEDLAMVRENGCHLAQGFYFSRPLTQQQFVKLCEMDVSDFGVG